MSSATPLAALEIGTTKTVLAVGETQPSGRLKIIALGDIPSTGVRKSQIIDVSQVTLSIEAVLKQVEQQSDYSIGNALLAVSGPQIKTSPLVGSWQVDGRTVNENDVNAVRERTQETSIDETQRTILDQVPQDFALDDLPGIKNPEGMSGQLLKLRMLCIHGSRNRIEDAISAANRARLEIADAAFAGICAANAVLTQRQRNAGALVIDLGGGSTSYAAYADGILAAAGVIGVGGDHVTNDIALAFTISNTQAEELKKTLGSAIIESENEMRRAQIPSTTPGFEAPSISVKALATVINARMRELFSILSERLDEDGLLNRFNAGVFLTGGGSSMRNIVSLAAHELGANIQIGIPINVDGLEKTQCPAAYATIAGLLLFGQKNYDSKPILKPLAKLIGGLFHK